MKTYILRRLLVAVPVLLLISIMVFFLIHLLPGDPVIAMLGEEATPEMIQALREEMGLDKPLYQQYLSWLTHCLSGDLGRSIQTKQPVSKALTQRLPVTIELTLLAFLIALMISLPIAIASAVRPNSWIDLVGSTIATLGIAMPSFWLGILLIYLFAAQLRWLPASGYVPPGENLLQNLRHMILPTMTLGMCLATRSGGCPSGNSRQKKGGQTVKKTEPGPWEEELEVNGYSDAMVRSLTSTRSPLRRRQTVHSPSLRLRWRSIKVV